MMDLIKIKTWVYSKLSTDMSLTNLMNGVNIYDIVQENSPLPYISYEKIISNYKHQLDVQVREHLMTFSIMSKADSSLTTHNIMARMEQVFDEEFEQDDLGDGYKLLSLDIMKAEIAQSDFETVKAIMQIKLTVRSGL